MSSPEAIHDHDSLITLSAASALSGYSIDYLSRLCKSGKIKCFKGDRAIQVYADALRIFLQETEEKKRLRAQKLSEERRIEYGTTRAIEEIATENIVIPEITEVSEAPRKRRHHVISGISTIRRTASLAASTFAAIVFLTSIWFGLMQEGGLSNLRQLAVAYETLSPLDSAALNWYHFVNNHFAWMWGAKQDSFVAVESPASGTMVPAVADTPSGVPTAKPFTGAVVVPRDPKVSAEKQARAITSTFSDEVRVQPLADGTGIITPVFKTATSQEYLYVMVPMATSSP